MSIDVTIKWPQIEATMHKQLLKDIQKAHQRLLDKSGQGSDFLGWVDWPIIYDAKEIDRIKETADEIREKCNAFVVVGVGGSYLGARAAIEGIRGSFYNDLPKDSPNIYYMGNNLSGSYLKDLMGILENKDVCVNVISKSGTTTEPGAAFRVIKAFMEKKYGKKEASKRIFATTDENKGALLTLAKEENYRRFVIEDHIGGRYSVMTPVGLLPMSVAGIDINEYLEGAKEAYRDYQANTMDENPCYRYVAYRNSLYRQGKKIEVLATYEPDLSYLASWWQQLYGESEGKQEKGIYPAKVDFTTDLHAMGQYIQEGERILFETVVHVREGRADLHMPMDKNNLDGLNYLCESSFNAMNNKAMEGTSLAHIEGGVPNCVISIKDTSSFTIGKLMYFFMLSCGISGYVLGVNPFDQPGVEAYKKNMFALLGKPGYEALAHELKQK
jgi:glucose-6-phosphate isomerase